MRLACYIVLIAGSPAKANDFDSVASIFERRCLSCHSTAERKGGLSLATAAAALAGGESGASIVSGKPDASFLLDYVSGDDPEMPKSGEPLSAEEVAALRRWIAAGAKWPEGKMLRDRSLADANWWSLLPLRRPKLPPIQNPKSKIQNLIDVFIVAKLSEKGLPQSPAADRRTLIRRLSFDLTGLPPTPEEIGAFYADERPDAYERLVDRLLASPRYGERWARHWLDVVHYGETHGYDKDKPRPNAWPYRDYVIRAFNGDKPYGCFVEEQIAGDVLYPLTADGVEALGFIAAGPWDFIGHVELPETKIDGQVARHLDRDDMVQSAIGAFNSLTAGCAQCHDHKFDPIPQEDYYRLQAVFAAVDRTDKKYDRDPAVAKRRAGLNAELARLSDERKRIDADVAKRGGEKLKQLDQRIAALRKQASGQERPEFGYHSAIEAHQDRVKWVQVDLGSSQALARVEYVACHDDFHDIGAGFGFPLRYRLEIADDPEFQTGVTTLVDRTASDVPNPGVAPQVAEAAAARGRYVRFTATKLAPRLPSDFIFALGELSVFTPAGENIAAGKAVTSLDSIEAAPRWRRSNLVDGFYYGQASGAAKKTAELSEKRERLIASLLEPEVKERLDEIGAATESAEMALKSLPPQQVVYAGTVFRGSGNFAGTGGKPRPIFILNRGNVTQPGEEVAPGALSCLPIEFSLAGSKLAPGEAAQDPPSGSPGLGLVPAKDSSEGDRRAALARWLSDPRNPLTWRSIANRLWQYHFGRGIALTPNDFGRMGTLPTHPELLDWLAAELRDRGQSLKRLHRLMVTSHTYRQTSSAEFGMRNAESDAATSAGIPHSALRAPHSIDADNRYLWRASRRRLEAEAVRDAVLLVAGRLDTSMGGPSFQDFVIEQPEHSPHYEYHLHDPDDPATHRRSIYRFVVRSQPQPFMTTLDCADPSQRVAQRNESLSALQALALLNNGFMLTMSRHYAERLEGFGGDTATRVDRAVLECLGRPATDAEREALMAYADEHGLANLCRLLFNLNEFVFVE